MVAFTRSVSESLGEERKWVHYGLTSTDVVDTTYGYLYKQANDILRNDLKNFAEIVKNKALEHKYTVMMGRTHGVHAEPTTFGLKLATWYSEMKRNIERFEHTAKAVEAGKISGAVGTFANIPPFVEAYVCEKLGLVRKRFQHKSYHVIYMQNTSKRWRSLRHQLNAWQQKSVDYKNLNNVKLKNSLLKVKKAHQQCHTNVTQLVLKI